MDDDNIFDEDDALDYIMYEEVSKNTQRGNNKSTGGCLSLLILLTIPVSSIAFWLFTYTIV